MVQKKHGGRQIKCLIFRKYKIDIFGVLIGTQASTLFRRYGPSGELHTSSRTTWDRPTPAWTANT
ncbi:hypothetical protein EMIT0P74_60341 [Pseudomonas sp. IT-P74]